MVGGTKLPPPPIPPYKSLKIFTTLWSYIFVLAYDISLWNLAILLILTRHSSQYYRQIFPNWSMSKVETTVEKSILMVTLTAAVFAIGERTTHNKGGMADEFYYFIIILLIQLNHNSILPTHSYRCRMYRNWKIRCFLLFSLALP